MPKLVAEMKISMDEAGQVQVEGPLDNKILFYGLLEVAKETCVAHHKNKERLVQPIPASAIQHFGGPGKN